MSEFPSSIAVMGIAIRAVCRLIRPCVIGDELFRSEHCCCVYKISLLYCRTASAALVEEWGPSLLMEPGPRYSE
jgi:hypothetical protein